MPFCAQADCDEEGYADCGTTGDVKWYMSEDQTTLTISGNGNMGNYTAVRDDEGVYYNQAPWGAYHDTLTSVDIKSGVTGLGTYAFLAMGKITNVNLPDTLLDIGRSSFNRCYGLKNITIPQSVETIGNYALQFTALESIIIPDNVTTIAPYAFGYNYGLKSIVIGDNVTTIASQAFKGSEDAYIYCQNTSAHTCRNLIEEHNPDLLGKLRLYTIENGKIKVGSKTYNSLDELPQYTLKRIYTLKEAEEVAGPVNRVSIRYK
ncbi:MAG: leucine-rich repeat domain-containing protein [Alphaproteobacteria bacterium]|nr:leucine-rich repeat domain-containing protein [Alphaproteobacteria bacterium]